MTAVSNDARPRYLWLTRFFPYPAHAGDRIYSARLIEALAAQACDVTVFCAEAAGNAPSFEIPKGAAERAEWAISSPGNGRRLWLYPLSRLPRHAVRLSGHIPRKMLQTLLNRQKWDAVLIDYVSMGWALPLLTEQARKTKHRPILVYISHNHEASLRRLAFRQSTASLPVRLAQWIDGARIGALERALVGGVDLVTANTAYDMQAFRSEAPNQRYSILVPGYDGPQVEDRRLTSETPRRMVVVGSFDWIVKQQNLLGFLEAAAAPLARHGIGIDIVGSGPAEVLEAWRRRFPTVAIHGRVEAVEPYLQDARISVVPELTGGGFKHKVLNAVFQRSPLFGIAGSITEVPLEDGRSIRLFPDFSALVAGIIRDIDDIDGLNTQQIAAYQACRDGFHWNERGEKLHSILTDLAQKLQRADAGPPPN